MFIKSFDNLLKTLDFVVFWSKTYVWLFMSLELYYIALTVQILMCCVIHIIDICINTFACAY